MPRTGMNERDSWKEYQLGAWAQQFCAVVASPYFLMSNRLASEDTAMYLCIVAVGPVECHRANSEELCCLGQLCAARLRRSTCPPRSNCRAFR